jgi:hypothetical protein
MVEGRRIRLSAPAPVQTVAEDLRDIRDVFGLAPTSQVLSRITRTPIKTLARAASGATVRPRRHVEVVAEFARDVRGMMFKDPAWTDVRRESMRNWLERGEVEMDGIIIRPIDVLSDEDLARRALGALQAEIG